MIVITQEDTCSTCCFYMASPKVCRRYPPTPLMIGVKQGIASLAAQEPFIQGYFPNMMPNGWCGEHKPKISETETEN